MLPPLFEIVATVTLMTFEEVTVESETGAVVGVAGTPASGNETIRLETDPSVVMHST